MQDRFEGILDATRLLMRKGQREQACRLLAEARDRAAAEENIDEAALYASVRGSYLVAMGLEKEAQESYRDAERFSNGNAKLISARHLIYGMGRPREGLAKAEEILANQLTEPAQRQEARAIQGLARLALDQAQEAIKSLAELLSDLLETRIPASSTDLTLVEELAKRHMAADLCRAYLDLVEERAREDQDQGALHRILAAKDDLRKNLL